MRPDGSRPRKASGIIDPHFERKGGNGTDTGHRHQTAANRIMLDHLQENSMQSFVTLEDRPPYIQHGLNHDRKYWIAVLEELPDACFVAPTTNGSHQQAIRPQRAANVILNVDQLALEELPVGQK